MPVETASREQEAVEERSFCSDMRARARRYCARRMEAVPAFPCTAPLLAVWVSRARFHRAFRRGARLAASAGRLAPNEWKFQWNIDGMLEGRGKECRRSFWRRWCALVPSISNNAACVCQCCDEACRGAWRVARPCSLFFFSPPTSPPRLTAPALPRSACLCRTRTWQIAAQGGDDPTQSNSPSVADGKPADGHRAFRDAHYCERSRWASLRRPPCAAVGSKML